MSVFHWDAGLTDVLTPQTMTILQAGGVSDPSDLYASLVPTHLEKPVGKVLLEGVEAASLLARTIVKADDARLLLAGLWLWHDWLDASHAISQSIETPSGSFWHAIMHRREGDFFNSKYWNARCRNHPAHGTLAMHGAPIIAGARGTLGPWADRLSRGGWNADGFVDFAEFTHDRPGVPAHAIAVELQRLEWRVLFEHCARSAVGG